jgi:hypothetical protein
MAEPQVTAGRILYYCDKCPRLTVPPDQLANALEPLAANDHGHGDGKP